MSKLGDKMRRAMMHSGLRAFWMLVVFLMFMPGCDRNDVDPGVQNSIVITPASEISTFSATVSVTVKTKGIFTVIEKGVCWDVKKNPDISSPRLLSSSKAEQFTITLQLPEDDKDYFVRPYFKDDFGNTFYGNEITFKTLKDLAVTIVSSDAADISEITATIATSISSTGVGEIVSRGLCWSTQENPVIGSASMQESGSGPGEFSVELTQLSPNRKYYARGYAISNSGKVTYGNQVTFTTLPVQPFAVTVVTKEGPGVSTTYADVKAVISGTGNVAERGVCVNNTGNPTINDIKAPAGKGLGDFTSRVQGLTQGTIYYARAYATSNLGQTVYGNQVLFVTTLGGAGFAFGGTVVTNITKVSAVVSVSLQGTGIVAEKGFCWAISPVPTVEDNKVQLGSGATSYSGTITGLTVGTKYYVRPYAISSAGTIYGPEVSFNTPDELTVVTHPVTQIKAPNAVGGGSISGNGTVTARGVCWNTSPSPTIENNVKTTDGSGQGSFTSTLYNLVNNRTYYVRAYAVSAGGVTYGNQVTFFTTPFVAATVTTASVSGITTTSALSGGTVAAGSETIVARGVCWATTANDATVSGNKTVNGSGSGTFTSTLTGLAPGTRYYVKAYATNSEGQTVYGTAVSFVTKADITLTTTPASGISHKEATSGGVITGDTESVTQRGICWSTSPNPTTSSSKATGAATNSYSVTITNLLGSTTYYVRAFASTNDGATEYGNQISFTTLPAAIVTTTTPTAVTHSTALTGGTIVSDETITQRGVVWGTAPNPVRGIQPSLNSGSGTGSFLMNVPGLSANTTYYLRAFAVTSTGQTVYGDEKVFTTAQ